MIIRFRPDGDVKNDYEPEAQAVLDEITEGVLSGKLLVGYSEKTQRNGSSRRTT